MAPAGTWNSQDIVVFGPSSDGNLYQINVKRGGMATPVTTPVTTRETSLHRRPSFLPDGQRFLYVAGLGTKNELRVGSLTTRGHGCDWNVRITRRLRRGTLVLHAWRELDGAVLQ